MKVGSMRKRFMSLSAAAMIGGSSLAALTGITPAFAADGCAAPASQSSPTTVESSLIYGRTVELRYSNKSQCAWGRIENGQAVDNMWLNRENTNGSNYQDLTSLGGKATIGSGSTSAYTPQAFYDGGVLMRGCGKAGNRSAITCTGWY